MSVVTINKQQYLDLEKIAIGAFAPLSGFMNEDEFSSVVRSLRLPDGTPFPLPVVLDLPVEEADRVRTANRIVLEFEGKADCAHPEHRQFAFSARLGCPCCSPLLQSGSPPLESSKTSPVL